ncbi:MAG: exodeoxyribonuclease VII small subunit [Eubacteriales bacterium]|nr:exodeoxyribonuclease VII small subunit [Eubacteriales bacterium]
MSKAETEDAVPAKELTIEESFDKLDEILEKMEDENVGLEETFKLYEQGLGLIKSAGDSIDRIEKQIRVLSEEA